MAKLLISCDDYIFCHEGHYYFKNKEWYNFYQRYLRVFETIRIANRVISEDSLNPGRVLIDESKVEIYPIPIFHGPFKYMTKYFSVGRALNGAVNGCDAAILRLPSTVAQRLSKSVIQSKMPYACEIVFNAKDGQESSSRLTERVLWWIIDKRMRSVCAMADGVSCVTQFQLQKRYYSIKPRHFNSHYSSLELRKEFFSAPRQYPEKDVLTIAHVSNQIKLWGRKGEAVLIEAIGLLKRQSIIVNVAFAGDDWDNSSKSIYEYAHRHGVADQVSCMGYLSREQLEQFLNDADLFVLPTKAEGLPRVIIEAMAKGLPTITSPVSGNSELISNRFLVDYDDVVSLSEKIKALVQNKTIYEEASLENYTNSLNYEASVLEKRRDAFYMQLKKIVENKK